MLEIIMTVLFALVMNVVLALLLTQGAFKRNGKFYINLPELASILGAMEAAGFEISTIVSYIFDELRGTASHDIPNAVLQELEDITLNFIETPTKTAVDAGVGYAKPRITFKLLGMGFDMFHAKKSITIGKVVVRLAG